MVAELRRLLIEPNRLADRDINGILVLRKDERHYLRRVLRLRPGATVAVIDGRGRLLKGQLQEEGTLLRIISDETASPAISPQLGLAIALVRHGMDDVIRMTCELGVDCIQPLQASRCTPQADYRPAIRVDQPIYVSSFEGQHGHNWVFYTNITFQHPASDL